MKKIFLIVLGLVTVLTIVYAQSANYFTMKARKVVARDSVNFTSSTILSTSSFVGDSVVKTIAVSGGETTDKYFACYTGTPGDSTIGSLSTTAFAGAFTVRRLAAYAEGNQAFVWFRSK